MIHKNRKEANQILSIFPQMENLTENQTKILNLLKEQRKPMLAKTISARLLLDYNTTRARLSELLHMGFIHQPNRYAKNMNELSSSGVSVMVPGAKKCGYSILTLRH